MNEFLEYKDLYIQTSRDYIQSLNACLLKLEKEPGNKEAIEEIFRSAHSLKSQSAAMEYQSTGYLCHTVEDVFYEIKQGRMQLTAELSDHLFTAFDALADAINHIEKENHEIDLTQQIETLKQLSGVKTEGDGKTVHDDPAATEPMAAPTINPPQTTPTAPPAPTQPAPPTVPEPKPAVPPAAVITDQPTPPPTATNDSGSPAINVTTIAVKVEVLDEMMNVLENLLVERLKLKRISNELGANYPDLKDYFNASEKMLASLQYQITKARAVPVSLVFDHFPRAVRDLARAENKQIELVVSGGDLELDRTIVERLDEPLIHLLRNAVSHGIQTAGTITLSARRQKDYAEISVADNGQGIDWAGVAQKAGLPNGETNSRILREALFSGISTSQTVTQISGRGVGLLAIKKMVDNFGGSIDVSSEPGRGTTFTIKLPLTLAIAKALIVVVGQQHFAIPTLAIDRLVAVPEGAIKKIAEQEVIVLDETEIPLVRLSTKLAGLHGGPPLKDVAAPGQPADHLAVIVGENTQQAGLVVDAVQETSDIVIKPVPEVLKNVSGFAGVTILSDGQTALILNIQELL
ncbi:MAG TPA: chemotaxis protein CheA [Bacillota bacterium]|nr:chemotaxis protein CheA [Bacillota bacterium]